MDVRLTSEQRQLRDAAAGVAAELGPGSVADLGDANRVARLEKAVTATGFRTLRTDGASGVEVALVAEEFARGLVDVPYLGPVLADDLRRAAADGGAAVRQPVAAGDPATRSGVSGEARGANGRPPARQSGERSGVSGDVRWTVGAGGRAVDAAGRDRVLWLEDGRVCAAGVGDAAPGADPTRRSARIDGTPEELGALSPERAARWRALAITATAADLLGAARGAQDLAVGYAKVREQYGRPIGTYQAVAHLLAESRALVEGSISVLRHAAWAVDELPPAEALRAARVAKVYTARAARTVCETSIQVHGGIGNTWECLAHVFLRRVLTSTELFPVRLKEIDRGLS